MSQLSNYSVTLNAVPALAAGNFTAGQAVCRVSPTGGYVLATTANRAWATGAMWGVALENGFTGGNAVQIVNSGYVPPEVFPSPITGSGDYVNVNASGNLIRSSTATADSIGRFLPDGGVNVDIMLQIGGAVTGNATAIQGVPVLNATAGRSRILRNDGTDWLSVRDHYVFTDFKSGGTRPSADSVTSWYDHFMLALSDVPKGGVLYIPSGGTGRYVIDCGTNPPPKISDDNPGGNKNTILLYGDSASYGAQAGSALEFRCTPPTTSVGTYISKGSTGGAPSQVQWRMGGWTGLGSHHIGRRVWLWNCKNAGVWIISGVYNNSDTPVTSGGTRMSLQSAWYDEYSGGDRIIQNDAAASGAIRGYVDMVGLEIRARACRLDGLILFAGCSNRLGGIVEVANPAGVGHSPVNDVVLHRCTFAGAAGSARHSLIIGAPYVPDAGMLWRANDADDGTSNTVTRVADSAAFGNGNVSEGVVERCWFYQNAWYSDVLHGSSSGQSVDWDFLYNYWFCVHGGYLVPQRFSGSAAANFEGGTWGVPGEDFCIRTYASNRACNYKHQYIEAWGGLLYSGGVATGGNGALLSHCHLRGGSAHLSGAMVYAVGQGPYNIKDGVWGEYVAPASDGYWCAIHCNGGTAGEPVVVNVSGVQLRGSSTAATAFPARKPSGAIRGVFSLFPADIGGLEPELDIEEAPHQSGSGAAAGMAITFNSAGSVWTNVTANFNSAANADVTVPAGLNSAIHIGFDQRYCALVIDYLNGTAGTTGVIQWQFWNNSAGWTNFSSVSDASNSFKSAPADGFEIRWRMPSFSSSANAWKSASATTITGGGVVDATLRYWVRGLVTTGYGVAPVLDQGFVNHKKTITFTEQDIVDACASASKYDIALGAVSQTVLAGSGLISIPLFGAGSARLQELYLLHLNRVINYQCNLYGWKMGAYSDQDMLQQWITSMGQSHADQADLGPNARIRVHTHARTGKLDLSSADWLNYSAGIVSGNYAFESAYYTGGYVETYGDQAVSLPVEAWVDFKGNKSEAIAGAQNALWQFPGPWYFGNDSTTTTVGSGTAVQIKRATITIAAGVATITTGATITTKSLAAAVTDTCNLSWLLPPGARLAGCSVQVTTKVQDAGDTDTTSCDVGITGTADFALKAASLKSTGSKGYGARTGTDGQRFASGAVQSFVTINSNVNLNTLTAGNFTVELQYRVIA